MEVIGRMSLSESTANAVLQVSKYLKVTACLTRWPAVASNIRTLRGPRWKAAPLSVGGIFGPETKTGSGCLLVNSCVTADKVMRSTWVMA